MISFKEAQKLIEEHCPKPNEELLFTSGALGRVNSRDLKSPISLPVFDNSAMDGFLLRSEDTSTATAENPVFLKIKGAIRAGDGDALALVDQETYRVMTGAAMIQNADAVIAKEKAVVKEDLLVVSSPVLKGLNVRYSGEELKKGELILPKGSVINPGTIGFLASMGIDRIYVYRVPKISLIATGSELVAAGHPLKRGKIYDSNTPMIKAALEEMGIRAVFIRKAMDEPKTIKKILSFALKESDILILMGGVSVGDYDFVKELLQEAGVKTIFWNVSQKPGKPLYFGKKAESLVFGLPGNPASVFTCFYEYVYPAIRMFMGHENPYLRSQVMKIAGSFKPDFEKTLFIKGKTNRDNTVSPLRHQKSHMLSSLCEANSFMVIPPSQGEIKHGEETLVHSLPYALERVEP